MPIIGLSDQVRMPRLGKIHLGVKVQSDKSQSEYPKATDYFVVPEDVQAVYGNKPTELEIMFPTENPEQFAQQWLRAYSQTQGLVCIGDGEKSRRKVDIDTGAMASHETKLWEWMELTCDPQECPEYEGKRCRRVMNLQFMIPTVPGLGVYQIDTSSFYSIVNINSMIKMLKGILGRCSMIPLTLALGPVVVSPPGITQKTVYIMHIKTDVVIAELAKVAQLPPARVLIPEPDTEEAPEDLFPKAAPPPPPEIKKPKAKVAGPAETDETMAKGKKPDEITPEDTPDLGAVFTHCFRFWGKQPPETLKELGYHSSLEVTEAPWECWLKAKDAFEPKKIPSEEPPSDDFYP